MNIQKRLAAAAIATALLPVFPTTETTAAEESTLMYDINGDLTIGAADMVMLSKYLLGAHGITDAEAARADCNDDGIVDTFDLVGLREAYVYNCSNVPQGTWIADGMNGTRYFWFDENSEGTFALCENGKLTPFRLSSRGGKLTFSLSSGAPTGASISWTDENHFYLKWDGAGLESFTYASDVRFDRGPYLEGTYVIDGSEKDMKFANNYTASLSGENFNILPQRNHVLFLYDDGSTEKASFSRTDKNHFTLKWDDGRKADFTRREITVKDGITYVNGILIANKTYSLPRSYDPKSLTPEFTKAFSEMKRDAANDGISLEVFSGYRSYSYQKQIYENFVAMDGKAAADTYSARPGHSEHQTGLAADINTAEEWFIGTPEAIWLDKNCYKYGFIIRYPQGKQNITGYIYEPWHIRYLGKENAKLVHDSELTLEEYLGIDSKYAY